VTNEDDGPDAVAHPADPAVAVARPPLTRAERRRVALWSVAPIGLAALVLTPIAVVGPATAGDVVSASLVYGGLLGLAAGFVAVDRFHARMCPRCGERGDRSQVTCAVCGYDRVRRPRYACSEGHEIRLAPGTCSCGRRANELPVVRGIGREIAFVLKVGAWLLAFLLGVGFLLQFAAA